MTNHWFTLISVLSGTAIGGLINYLATSRAKVQEWRLSLVRERVLERQKLYADFLASSQSLVARSMDDKISKVSEIGIVFNELARIELIASHEVTEAAKNISSYVLDSHAAQPRKEEMDFFKLKSGFIAAVRKEIDR